MTCFLGDKQSRRSPWWPASFFLCFVVSNSELLSFTSSCGHLGEQQTNLETSHIIALFTPIYHYITIYSRCYQQGFQSVTRKQEQFDRVRPQDQRIVPCRLVPWRDQGLFVVKELKGTNMLLWLYEVVLDLHHHKAEWLQHYWTDSFNMQCQ